MTLFACFNLEMVVLVLSSLQPTFKASFRWIYVYIQRYIYLHLDQLSTFLAIQSFAFCFFFCSFQYDAKVINFINISGITFLTIIIDIPKQGAKANQSLYQISKCESGIKCFAAHVGIPYCKPCPQVL